MKVAFATEDLTHVNAHFGWAKKIAVYEISADDASLAEVLEFGGELEEDGNEDKLMPKIEAITDCAILYVSAIGGSGAARVVARNVHPVRVPETETIANLVEKLQVVLRGTPPPWLRKAVNKGKERIFDFDNEVLHG
jgi:nitrogen fixation protein NifX